MGLADILAHHTSLEVRRLACKPEYLQGNLASGGIGLPDPTREETVPSSGFARLLAGSSIPLCLLAEDVMTNRRSAEKSVKNNSTRMFVLC
jgi:hypothetical protein